MANNMILPLKENQLPVCWEIRVRGTVQGVGFRPTVYKLATEYGITGFVLNDGEGVLIEAWATESKLAEFVKSIVTNSPPLAQIEAIDYCLNERINQVADEFVIDSSARGETNTNISADAATCRACLEDVFNPRNRRFRYPFTNCTHCGPRFSIVRAIPYDRAYTSMNVFKMCDDCQKEYDDPGDRRFHAQPNACHACGPKVWLEANCNNDLIKAEPIAAAAKLIEQGAILAIKGIGGFHLACDATSEEAVNKLRQRKQRYQKPLALMAKNIAMIENYCLLSQPEARLLTAATAPIVVLTKLDFSNNGVEIAKSVAPGQKSLGFMLPYTPLHHLLLDCLKRLIVLTSGNRSEEPQCIDNDQARKSLAHIADYLLLHDREIVNRLDDSVARVSYGESNYLRRGRGMAPKPIPLPPGFENAPEILAMGSELKNTFCLIKNGNAIISQHLGDLQEAKTFIDYKRNLTLYKDLYQHKATRIAIDLHPEYLSSKLGRIMATEQKLPLDEIQHHHAHIASCLADNGYPLNGNPVLGIALDGLGYGSDGTFWGGEFLLADYISFERVGTFKPVALLGGTMAMKEPWRNTYAHLMSDSDWQSYHHKYQNLELTSFFETKPLATFDSMLESKFNSPLASSCGRLFDAVAAALNICRSQASYEGQAAMELEAIVDMDSLENKSEQSAYIFNIRSLNGGIPCVDARPVWQGLLKDLQRGTETGIIAARFHHALAKVIIQMVRKLSALQEHSLDTIVLSGGVFQNRILERLVLSGLHEEGFYKALVHRQVPANDGGLALGQAVISAARQMKLKENPCALAYQVK